MNICYYINRVTHCFMQMHLVISTTFHELCVYEEKTTSKYFESCCPGARGSCVHEAEDTGLFSQSTVTS